VRRMMSTCAAVGLGLLFLLPPAAADEAAAPGGFWGFESFDTHAQGQVATLTGYLNAFREDNRIVGALSEINGPPANSRNIAAFIQRGQASTFVYGVIGGPGGARGTLPDPPPGEANAYYPTDPPESSFAGPITAAGQGQVVDGRFHAEATEVPTGRAEGAVTKLTQEGQFTVEKATVVSHTEPVEGGVSAESVSVLHRVQVGPLLIQNLVSRASAFVPAAGGEPKGIASTVIEGATVNGTPVQVTDKGVVVSDNANPLGQEQVNKAFTDAGFDQVRLLPSVAKPGDDNSSVTASAGVVEFVKQDQNFGASNPQGFSGGGFSIGGAEAIVSSSRCAPDCAAGGLLGLPPDPVASESGGGAPVEPGSAQPLASGTAPLLGDGSTPANLPPLDAGYQTDASGSGLSGGSSPVADGGPAIDYSSTTAVTPPSLDTAAGGRRGSAPVRRQAALASSDPGALGPKEAGWVRDLYLALGIGALVLYIGQRLARAF
jgi:hypothetical protein